MNKVNNAEEINYKDIVLLKSIYQKEYYPRIIKLNRREGYNYEDLINISKDTAESLLTDVLRFSHNYEYAILEFADLLDTNEKYVILDTLLTVITSTVAKDDREKPASSHFIYDKLREVLEILRLLNPEVLKSFVNELKNSIYLANSFINKGDLFNNLSQNKIFMKDTDPYKNFNGSFYEKLDSIFLNIKDNQR